MIGNFEFRSSLWTQTCCKQVVGGHAPFCDLESQDLSLPCSSRWLKARRCPQLPHGMSEEQPEPFDWRKTPALGLPLKWASWSSTIQIARITTSPPRGFGFTLLPQEFQGFWGCGCLVCAILDFKFPCKVLGIPISL